MKLYKKLASALMVLPLLAALTACSDDSDWAPGEALESAQVYFPNTQASGDIKLPTDANTFQVEIDRVNTEGGLTVGLTATQDSTNYFTVPESVTFEDGADKAYIEVGYDGENLYNAERSLTIAIANADYTTPYGDTKYSIEITAPWSDWGLVDINGNYILGKVGTGTYTYEQMWSGDDPEREVYFRQNTVDPTQGEFKICGIYYGVDVVFPAVWSEDYQIWMITVPETFTGYTHSSYGDVYVTDYVNYWKNVRADSEAQDLNYDPADEDNGYPNYYNPETGTFALCLVFYVDAGYFGAGYEYCQMDGFVLPDYSATATYVGVLKDASSAWSAVIGFDLADDVASAKYAMYDASASEAEMAAAIVSGDLESTEITEDAQVNIPLEEDGNYRVTIVTFDENGDAQESASCAFEFEAGGSSWSSLGIGAITDDCFTTFYDLENVTWEVEILANAKTPGLYRLVYPYGAGFPYNEDGDYDTASQYNLDIHAEDPSAVYFGTTPIGVDWGYGMVTISSMAGYYLENDMAEEAAAYMGTLVDGIITFPTKGLLIGMADYQSGNLYYANTNGAFKIVLPEAYEAAVKANKIKKANTATRGSFQNNAQAFVWTKDMVRSTLKHDFNNSFLK